MKLLRNSYREILILLYFSLVAFLPVVTVVRIVHDLSNLSLLVLTILLGTFLSLIGVLVFYFFLSAVLHIKNQNVESFYR